MTRFDLPSPDLETQPFWDAARDARLLIRHCNACGEYHFYPRPFCPSCWSDDVEWFEASGRATLYTWSIVYQNDLPPWPERVPYVAAVVELAEGPRMQTNVVDCEFGGLCNGLDLQVVFHPTSDDFTIPVFRPAAASSDSGAPGAQ
jgi:uncharacterized OB-fold protein